ncbi:hypothetical protein BKA82DRAFT_30362 [Pisolithus tinctorius]|uniref:HTH CENPB-type domain-containing protein n=1 Tax=Pisolithus tinctorius Marx 270 TaxID=870435 RepID=A0A0C3NEG5_PISTI|nr:hypothetical protein BKA82DRAFT_30362 [Pisolithus tinctorius]KIN99489.1 hypothetical protein M404DRAFT_30362 [Pisolithus tinctorius Marx 270]
MPGHAKSDSKKQQIAHEAHDGLMAWAVHAYQIELAKGPLQQKQGAHTICTDFEQIYYNEYGKQIKLSHSTLIRLADGGISKSQSNAQHSWLTDQEVNVALNYIIEMGDHGFPLSHHRLKEHVDEICHARLGAQFPATGVGINWTHHFAEKHSNQIKMSCACPLKTKHGHVVNPTTNEAWWSLLKETISKYNVKQHNTYGVDKMGCQPQGGEQEHVFGRKKKGPQYQQHGGNCENITIIITICADGTATSPSVILKGSTFQVKWNQDNPANAS